jgi:hypothetical protein
MRDFARIASQANSAVAGSILDRINFDRLWLINELNGGSHFDAETDENHLGGYRHQRNGLGWLQADEE